MARVITEETLFELINLAAGPQKYLPSGLQVDTTLALDLVCTLKASVAMGRDKKRRNKGGKVTAENARPQLGKASIWRPVPPKGYYSLGDLVFPHCRSGGGARKKDGGSEGDKGNNNENNGKKEGSWTVRPTKPVLVVRDDGGELVAPPLRFQRVWRGPPCDGLVTDASEHFQAAREMRVPVSGSLLHHRYGGACDDGVSVWRPVPPPGFVSLGHIVLPGNREPERWMVRCLHRSCVHASFFSQRAFASSGAPADTSANVYPSALSSSRDRRKGGGEESDDEVVQGPLSLWRVNNASGTFVASVSPQFLQPAAASALHAGGVEGSGDDVGSPRQALWLLQLLVDFDSAMAPGFGALAPFVFRAELVHTLLNFVSDASGTERINALRMLATLLRRTPAVALTPSLQRELCSIREEMERLREKQVERGLYSAYLCALVEVGVSIALRQAEAAEVAEQTSRAVAAISESIRFDSIRVESSHHLFIYRSGFLLCFCCRLVLFCFALRCV